MDLLECRQVEEDETMTQAEKEIDKLADFLMQHYPRELGLGNLAHGESAVDVAIRLLVILDPGLKTDIGKSKILKTFNPSLRGRGE